MDRIDNLRAAISAATTGHEKLDLMKQFMAARGNQNDLDDLDPNSPNYRYRDTGYIAGSRKELAAAMIRNAAKTGTSVKAAEIDFEEIEQNPREAKTLITKSNLFGAVDWEAAKANGMTPAAGFLIDRVYASIAKEPEDNPQKRRDYALGIESIRDRMEKCKTHEEVLAVLAEIKDEWQGVMMNAAESQEYQDAVSVARELGDIARDAKKAKDEVWQTYYGLDNQLNSAKYEQSKRRDRKWKPDPELDAKVADLQKRRDEAYKIDTDFRAAHPELASKSRELGNGSISHDNDLEYAARLARNKASDIKAQVQARNLLENESTRAWIAFGEKFQAVLNYRGYKGSDAFSKHVGTAKVGKITDWSWAEKDPRTVTLKGEATKEQTKFQLKVADNIERIGGKPISAESTAALKEMLGLRDVQSGNWVLKDPASAAFHVQRCAEAFSDLGDIIGVDMGNMALGGRLAMAFGARGHGGASAHYEPVQRVINLTKMSGGGSLGHEWLHSLDNMIAEIETGKPTGTGDFVSENPSLLPAGAIQAAFIKLRQEMHTGDVPETQTIDYTDKDLATGKYNFERRCYGFALDIKNAGNLDAAIDVINAYYKNDKPTPKTLKNKAGWVKITVAYYDAKPEGGSVKVKTGETSSSFYAGAKALDGGKEGKYWSKTLEMFARAFQSYCEDKLAELGRKNDYLSSMADNQYYKDPLLGDTFPYPEGEERKRINAVFDELFTALKDKGTLSKVLDSLLGGFENLQTGNEMLAQTLRNFDYAKPVAPVFDSVEKARNSRVPSNAPILKLHKKWLGKIQDIIKEAKNYARENFAGKTVFNKQLGKTIVISFSGVKHTLSGKVGEDLANSISLIPDILERGMYLGNLPENKGNKDVKAHHYIGIKLDIDGKIKDVVADVRELTNGHFYYDHSFERENANIITPLSKLDSTSTGTTSAFNTLPVEGIENITQSTDKSSTMPVFDKVETSDIESLRASILSASTGSAKLALMKQFMALRGENSALEQNSDLETFTENDLKPQGKDSEIKTAKGTKIATGFAVVEAQRLIVSHDNQGNENPEYPYELQPRDRKRAESVAWVLKTAKNLDVDSLGKTRRADSGAPIIGKDRVVESGNGRTMAIIEAYRIGAADEYREWLIEEAESFGLNPEKIKTMKKPILVRVRKSKLDRVAFATEANQDDKLAMTATEKAKADANRLTPDLVSRLKSGDLQATENRDFILGFMKSLGDTESAQYTTTDGKPTKQIFDRIQAALFAHAYNDDRLLQLMADDAKPEIKNILSALNVAAPDFIKAKSINEAAHGKTARALADSVDVSLDQEAIDAIIKATNVIMDAKNKGLNIDEYLAQDDIFGYGIEPEVAAMALFIKDNNRSSERLGMAFKEMATFVKAELEERNNTSLFGDDDPVNLVDVLKVANDKLKQAYGDNVKTIGGQNLGGFIDLFTETKGHKETREAFLEEQEAKAEANIVTADLLAKTTLAEAIDAALSKTSGQVKTSDNLLWTVTKTALNKMTAATNKDGEKAYQQERIIAIQQLNELASNAKAPLIRPDDGQDEQVEAIYEYNALFRLNDKTFTARLLCKKWKNPNKRQKDKMHSLALDEAGSPVNRVVSDGLLIGLELVELDGMGLETTDNQAPPSVDNDLSIAQPDENASDFEPPNEDPNVALLQATAAGQHSDLDSETLLDMIQPAALSVDLASYSGLIDDAMLEWLNVDNKAYVLDSVYREAA